jgi:chromosomal replication initiation ATPase DnaA
MADTPSNEQPRATAEIAAWYRDPSRGCQVFYLAGPAGSGKTKTGGFADFDPAKMRRAA